MKNKPIWLENIKFKNPIKLNKNIKVDVLIIGGGITGLSTAYHLIDHNLQVCVVEKNLIAHAVSSKTTGKLTYLQDNIYSKLKNKAKIYYESQKDAIKIVEDIVNKHNIDCNFKKVASYIYTNKINQIKTIKKEEKMLKKLNIEYKKHNKLPINIYCKYAISVDNTAVFHPIKYLNSLKDIIIKNGINIYENSCVTSIEKDNINYICKVNNKTITAKKIVIASHYPYFTIPFLLPLRTYIEKSYLSATKIKDTKNFSAITVSKPITSIRYHEDINKYFIFLNNSHNLSVKYNNKDNFSLLLSDLKKMNLKPDFIWSNNDIMTEDHLPYIGYIGKNLLIGTGYNTWGMTNGSIAGKILSDLILEKHNKYENLFNPRRNKKLNIFKYPLFIAFNIKSFIENKIVKNKVFYKSNIKFCKINGKEVAIYTDENNKRHIVYNLCPHLKCSLIFNEIEKTWDCPCHGSRFDIDGKCIFGPSNQDITFKE